MKNGYEIFWTEHAIQELNDTLEYIELNWSEKEIRKLIAKIEEIISLIGDNPSLYQTVSNDTNIRKVPILKVNTLYYLFKIDKIYVLSFFSNRQNPGKLVLIE